MYKEEKQNTMERQWNEKKTSSLSRYHLVFSAVINEYLLRNGPPRRIHRRRTDRLACHCSDWAMDFAVPLPSIVPEDRARALSLRLPLESMAHLPASPYYADQPSVSASSNGDALSHSILTRPSAGPWRQDPMEEEEDPRLFSEGKNVASVWPDWQRDDRRRRHSCDCLEEHPVWVPGSHVGWSRVSRWTHFPLAMEGVDWHRTMNDAFDHRAWSGLTSTIHRVWTTGREVARARCHRQWHDEQRHTCRSLIVHFSRRECACRAEGTYCVTFEHQGLLSMPRADLVDDAKMTNDQHRAFSVSTRRTSSNVPRLRSIWISKSFSIAGSVVKFFRTIASVTSCMNRTYCKRSCLSMRWQSHRTFIREGSNDILGQAKLSQCLIRLFSKSRRKREFDENRMTTEDRLPEGWIARARSFGFLDFLLHIVTKVETSVQLFSSKGRKALIEGVL